MMVMARFAYTRVVGIRKNAVVDHHKAWKEESQLCEMNFVMEFCEQSVKAAQKGDQASSQLRF